MRILVINPALIRFEALGACEQDRLLNISDLMRLGHETLLLTRTIDHKSIEETEHYYRSRGFPAHVLPTLKTRWIPRRLLDVAYLDGSSWAYGAPDFLETLGHLIETWRPDLVWCHASYLWAPALFARKQGIPTVVRSVNYEPSHYVSESRWTKAMGPIYIGKYYGERRATRSTVLAAITPAEEAIYKHINRRATVFSLPLRTLPDMLRFAPHSRTDGKLRVFFMGASYNIPHNVRALEFIATEIIPEIRKKAPGTFEFHLLGSKVPPHLLALAAADLIFSGYVPDLEAYLSKMDIALSPHLGGQGMQQKLFEPLCRGFPTITHQRALAGYSFENDQHVLFADMVADYVNQLLRLRDVQLRQTLGQNAQQQARRFFDRAAIDKRTQMIIETAVSGDSN